MKAIQDLILEQERLEILDNKENLLPLSPHTSESTLSMDDVSMRLSPLTSPNLTPPASPTSHRLYLELPAAPSVKLSTLCSLSRASNSPLSMEDWSTQLSPQTSTPYPMPPASHMSNQHLDLPSISLLSASTSSIPDWLQNGLTFDIAQHDTPYQSPLHAQQTYHRQ